STATRGCSRSTPRSSSGRTKSWRRRPATPGCHSPTRCCSSALAVETCADGPPSANEPHTGREHRLVAPMPWLRGAPATRRSATLPRARALPGAADRGRDDRLDDADARRVAADPRPRVLLLARPGEPDRRLLARARFVLTQLREPSELRLVGDAVTVPN